MTRVPSNFLMKQFSPSLGNVTAEELAAVNKSCNKSSFRILSRLALLEPNSTLDQSKKQAFKDYYGRRISFFGFSIDSIVFDRSFKIDWERSGHFKLLPVVDDETARDAHEYISISFRGAEVALDGDYKVRGSYTIEENWFHTVAWIRNPARPGLKLVCKDFFPPETMQLQLPEVEHKTVMSLPDIPAPADLIAIQDGSADVLAVEDEVADPAALSSASSVVSTPTSQQISECASSPQTSKSTSTIRQPSRRSTTAVCHPFPGARNAPKQPPTRLAKMTDLVDSLRTAEPS